MKNLFCTFSSTKSSLSFGRFALLTLLSSFASIAPGHAQDEEKVLNVFNWSDYIAEDTIANFEEEFGIKVNYDVFDNNDIVVSKVTAGNSGYDIIVPTADHMHRLLKAGLLHKLDKASIPNLKYADPDLHKQIALRYDPGNQHSLIYQWGTTGLGYNVAEIHARLGKDAPIDSWDLLLDPKVAEKLEPCGIVLFDSVEEVLQPILLAYGYNPNEPSDEALEFVFDKLTAIRPYIRYFHSSQTISDLANGEICLATGWSGDMLQAYDNAKEGIEIGYTIPKEGSAMWADTIAIPADAPHVRNAHLFINYLMRPQVMADITEYVYYPNANTGAYELLDEEITGDPLVYPTEEVLRSLQMVSAFSQSVQRKVNRLWTRLKTGR